MRFLKAPATENDFVLLPDADGTLVGDLDPALVARLCDRRAGLGGDGVLRVVRTEAYDDPAAVAARGEAVWFMDYRNADGSTSEMCGNGIRVFGRCRSAPGPAPRCSPSTGTWSASTWASPPSSARPRWPSAAGPGPRRTCRW